MKSKNKGIVIDESNHMTAPSFFQRIKHVLMAVVIGIVFAQAILFAFRMGGWVIIHLMDNTPLVVAYLLICAVLGWFFGDKFIQSFAKACGSWWDLWGKV